ncbi:hypothetical protein [Weissella cibaria]|uniref:hypothetical protein n=1 Tax=Weissella cibaria TaxID=137591 RepID=UPI00202AFC15|nr:hypothetical protein [Weissella cibaria]
MLGETTLPLILGVVGGSIGIVPAVKLNHALMDNPTVNELTSTIAAVGLAQNLAAVHWCRLVYKPATWHYRQSHWHSKWVRRQQKCQR